MQNFKKISPETYLAQLLVPFFEPCCPAESVTYIIIVVVPVLSK